MEKRLQLHSKLVELLGSRHVYYQPPSTVKMEYPCIVYSPEPTLRKDADNLIYFKRRRYHLIYISRDPDDPMVDAIEGIRYCDHTDTTVVDRLYQTHFSLYF